MEVVFSKRITTVKCMFLGDVPVIVDVTDNLVDSGGDAPQLIVLVDGRAQPDWSGPVLFAHQDGDGGDKGRDLGEK